MKKVLKSVARRLGIDIRRIAPAADSAIFRSTATTDSDLLALRSFADRVARFAGSREQSQAVRDLYLAGILREQPLSEVSRIEVGGAHTMQVGAWRKSSRAKDAPFVRMPEADWISWARNETIEPKRGKWRVALVGESVARGYLYDPEFTPASALEQMLATHLGTADVEVVDLAMNSLTMQPLKELIGQSLALSPDVIVVFAGNNWHRHLEEADIPYVEGPLRTHGVPRLKSYIDSRVGHAVRQLTEQVNAVVSGRKIGLVWVVPESNLDDWHDPVADAPLIPGRGNRQWRELRSRASRALAERDLVLAEALAREMVELDGGTNSVPLRVLAECRRGAADAEGTRRYLEMCRDAEGWNPTFAYTPRTSATIQEALRETGSIPGNVLVDLPEVFSRYLEELPPGRRLFLDYCHLTAEGINVAMAAVAAGILKSIGRESASIEKLHGGAPAAAREVEGKACLLAAIHNAHYYQGRELATYWCERALRFWPECAQIMRLFVDFQTRRGDTLACRSAMELRGTRELVTLIRSGKKRLDLALVDAMVGCLASSGIDVQREVSELRATEHSLSSGPKELTDFYYSSTLACPSEPGWTSKSFSNNRASHCIYASAFSEVSKFVFFGERGRPVGLRLTYRVPDRSGSIGTMSLAVNGHRLAEAPADATWRTLEISVPSACVAEGLNEVLIAWPDEGASAEVLLDRAADALLARRIPHFYRVFGEVHALLAFDLGATSREAADRLSARRSHDVYAG